MTGAINPIEVVDQVIDEYRSYLLTEFRARDPKLRGALEEALTRPLFLAQEPFFQSHRPFKEGKPWVELGLDAKLAKTMELRSDSKTAYLHQSEAVTHLLGPSAGPLVVTTGTGSGKTECFLLPVLQNAMEDSIRFNRSGLTALLVYPMNALANDQEMRINDYLTSSGRGDIRVARYDRQTSERDRELLRKNPPHILLTNYMMLEYLLVRPSDRDAIFANHRCRFIVLDEVHSYRGSLGANIALLFRRLLAHLKEAPQEFSPGDPSDVRRYPKPVPVCTSATIKSAVDGVSAEEQKRLRDEAVSEFVAAITGFDAKAFRVVAEELRNVPPPPGLKWPDPQFALWLMGDLLARKPLSVPQIADWVIANRDERKGASLENVTKEVMDALLHGSMLPDDSIGALRLRAHRFLRGGWRFHCCLNTQCGRLYAMGEGQCTCGGATAPLLICRSCGADALHLEGLADPEAVPLRPRTGASEDLEWVLYDRTRLSVTGDEEDPEEGEATGRRRVEQIKDRPVIEGSFDAETMAFSRDEKLYGQRVTLAPARNRCLVCDASAGGGSILTPIALGTSAAVRVVAEGVTESLADQHKRVTPPGYDGKERILIFADSRQDAAHQARFISYAGRYDRMRRNVVRLLEKAPDGLHIADLVQRLTALGVERHDNPRVEKSAKLDYVSEAVQRKARAWEEAPLLDDIAVRASFRATLINLGLVGVTYEKLGALVAAEGANLATRLGITTAQLTYVARCVLDEMRLRGLLSRPMLTHHPLNPNCPEEIKAADWDRRVKRPSGLSCTDSGEPALFVENARIPEGVGVNNIWRRPGKGGRAPRLQWVFEHLLTKLGGKSVAAEELVELIRLLSPHMVSAVKLYGFKKPITLLQVNEACVVLAIVPADDRRRCSVCNVRKPGAPLRSPCPSCDGVMGPWLAAEVDSSRYVRRIRKRDVLPLVAGEHTAQVTGEDRMVLETQFKGGPSVSPLNVLACSPTLEMGIDVGGLDAVVMRNVPPRPDNYAQRGGRAGRRSRVGVVLGYARNTPHDQYFYDRPAEMIAGEVAAPRIGLGNRDVVIRHLNAIALSASKTGIKGRMCDYIDFKGTLQEVEVDALLTSFAAEFGRAADMALAAWGPPILIPAGLETREKLIEALEAQPARIRDLFDRVRHQIIALHQRIEQFSQLGLGGWNALDANNLIRRLLGLPPDGKPGNDKAEADDRGNGHPMRRFAEFGILPGYEFPSEPATLRLLRDEHEEDPISVERRFGLAQYQPGAPAHARGHRWRVAGLDMASPWNPRSEEPQWPYSKCAACGLRFGATEHINCPRCAKAKGAGKAMPGWEFGGFLAVRDDTPVADEEDRFALANLLQCHPQWNGDVTARYELPTGWPMELRREEDIRWVNEWKKPTPAEVTKGIPQLHEDARGFFLCSSCGRILTPPESEEAKKGKKGRSEPKKASREDPFGHATGCKHIGQPPQPLAITARTRASTLRFVVDLPAGIDQTAYQSWGLSLGYSLRSGMRLLYMLDGPEVEFHLELPWEMNHEGRKWKRGALTFIDAAVGGSGFLDRSASEMHLVAARALEHLDHIGCDSACYRCLKSYQNQRYHSLLSWPQVIEHLESLRTSAPVARPLEKGDVLDPKPWLDAYDAGVGSPLELRFLRLFEKNDLVVEKQYPVSAEEGKKPISLADFAIPDRRVVIYIDGACFHTGVNLRRDRRIREKLRAASPPWKVLEFGAKDLGTNVVQRIREA